MPETTPIANCEKSAPSQVQLTILCLKYLPQESAMLNPLHSVNPKKVDGSPADSCFAYKERTSPMKVFFPFLGPWIEKRD